MSQSGRAKGSAHRLDVQGLRTVAIFSVLLFHFYPQYFPNGYLGVDVFFVISGYLIFTIFSRSVQTLGLNWASISNFYYRRLARIVPLSLVYICCAVLAYSYMASPVIIAKSQAAAWRALLFVTNIFVVIEKDDYFERLLDENLFTHTWSLAVEVQYYLLVPILFLINACLGAKNRIFYPLVIAASLIVYIYSPPEFSFNMMPNRLWQFLLITSFSKRILEPIEEVAEEIKESLLENGSEEEENIKVRSNPKNPIFEQLIYYISFMLLSLSFLPFSLVLPSFIRMIVSFSSVLVIVFGDKIYNPVLSNRVSVFIGDISYSLYLFHWPFSVYLSSTTSPIDVNYGILLSLATTIAVYYAFEKRYRKWTKNVVLISSFLLSVFAISLILLSPQLNELMQKKVSVDKEAAIKENQYMFSHSSETVMIEKCNYTQWRNTTINAPLGLCTMPNGDGKLKFMLIGNSYSSNQGQLVYDAFKPYFSEFHIFAMSSCEVFTYTYSAYCKHPAEFKDVVPDFNPDVIFIIQRYGAPITKLPPPGKEDKVYNEMEKRLDLVYNMSSLFFVEDSFPAVHYGQMHKINNRIREGMTAEQINNVSMSHGDDPPARTRTKKLMKYCGEKCHLFDVEPAIVDKQGRVQAVDEKTWLAIFEPSSHFTRHGKKLIAPVFIQLARKHGAELKRLEKKLYPGD